MIIMIIVIIVIIMNAQSTDAQTRPRSESMPLAFASMRVRA